VPAATTVKTPVLKPKSKVRLLAAIRGVPEGTEGKVFMVNGLTWTRYWVDFDNGAKIGSIDRSQLATLDEWARRHDAPATAAAGLAETESGGGPAEIGEGGIPMHLLERSRAARARLTGG